jgi:hypothetical protein
VIPNAPVTSGQRAAISGYYLKNLWLSDGNPKVACPVDVLGATRTGHGLRVYTVIHCTSATAHCGYGTDYTEGLVADMTSAAVTDVQRDDAPDYSGMIAEGTIYPLSLRATALGYVNYGGPAWLRNLAAKTAGCPHGVH